MTWRDALEGQFVSSTVRWVAASSPPCSYSMSDPNLYLLLLEMFIFTLLPHSDLFFFWYRFAHKRSRDTSVSNSPGVLTKTSIHN